MAQENRRVTIYINGRQVENSLKGISAEMSKTRNQLRRLTIGTQEYNTKAAELKRLEGYYRQQTNALKGMGSQGGFASQAMSGLKSSFGALLSPVGLVTAGIGAAIAAISSGVRVIRETEVAMDDLQAITGLADSEMGFFRDTAVDFAQKFGESPKAILEAFKLAGSAKPELLESKEALAQFTEQAVILAKASKTDVSDAISSLTTIMNANGASADEASRYINVLAAGSQKGAKEVDFLAKAFEKVGPVAATAGLSIEQQTSFLELLGEKGFNSAETAGTSFRNILLTLQTDAANLTDGQLDLNKVFENYGPIATDATALTKVFGKENVAQAQAVLLNKERIDQLTDAVTGTNTAQEQAAVQMDNFDGKLSQLSARWDSLWASMEDGDSVLSWVVDHISLYLEGVQKAFSIINVGIKSMKNALGIGVVEGATERMAVAMNAQVEAHRAQNIALAERLKNEGKLDQYIEKRISALAAEEEGSARYKAIQDEIVSLKQVQNAEIEENIKKQAGLAEEERKNAEASQNAAKAKAQAEKDAIAAQKQRIEDKKKADADAGIGPIAQRDYTGEIAVVNDVESQKAQLRIDWAKHSADQEKQIADKQREDESAAWAQAYEEINAMKYDLQALAIDTISQLADMNIDKRKKKEIAALDSQKKAGLISEEQYASKVEQLERQAFEKKKRLDIATALMNGFVAATKANAQWGGPPASIPALIAIGAQTAANVALIAAQSYGEGGLVVGPSHSNGGVPAIMEGNEYVIRKKYVTPESLPMLEAINTGKIRYMDTTSAQYNTRLDREGKMVQMSSAETQQSNDSVSKSEFYAVVSAIDNWQKEFNVSLPLRELEKADERKQRIEKLANVA